MEQNQPSFQDFSLLKTLVKNAMGQYALKEESVAFCFLSLDLILNLQEDEIDDSMTDNHYLKTKGKESGHDRGIDAIFIDSSTTPSKIHFFSFKYTDYFDKIQNHFPSNEIDKILSFLNSLMQKNLQKSDVNKTLFLKVDEIWSIWNTENPNYVVHSCCNYYNAFEDAEKKRFEREINKYSNFNIEYHLLPSYINSLIKMNKKDVNGRIKAIDKQLFERTDGDIRALIVNVDARDLLRIIINDDDLRNKIDLDDFNVMKDYLIEEAAFEDNVRVYLKNRTRINKNIKDTALSDKRNKFFYFNNGITIVCKNFSYPTNQRAPIIEIENFQIVNGSQTVHALFDAFKEDPSKIDDINILCRIYQTNNVDLSTFIAEYTNSQNPVSSRDIRANDYIQKKIEAELKAKGFYYERKKGQCKDRSRDKRIDAEKIGQLLMAFFNGLPGEAKDKKRRIFADFYDSVFKDEITADKVLLVFHLFEKIESSRKNRKSELHEEHGDFEFKSYIFHASYYILYLLAELAKAKSIEINYDNIDLIWELYSEGLDIIERAIKEEQKSSKSQKEIYNHRIFFKSNTPKTHLAKILNEKKGALQKI
ncbi:MAG: AIPR family protein [Candidatus Aminicenantes bacterium]|nr:AIPR family protein [Candidatus Aminicenantes bacterium]